MKKLLSVVLVLVILCASAAVLAEEAADWTCPNCGREGNTGNFCPSCAEPRPAPKIICPNCGAEYDPDVDYIFCPNCAARLRPDAVKKDIAVGDVVTFGRYEQDNDLSNGPEAIEWIVLDVQDGKALLLSKCALDAKPYNTEWVDITWEQCTLRAWLNQDFLKAAFSETEQSAILMTHVDNSDAQGYSGYDTTGGKDTEDQIFLLSDHEAFDLYFTSDEARMCAPTDYAVANGARASSIYELDGRPTGAWWLRSPGTDQNYAADVDYDGSRSNYFYLTYGGYVVRPAFWLNLESGIF